MVRFWEGVTSGVLSLNKFYNQNWQYLKEGERPRVKTSNLFGKSLEIKSIENVVGGLNRKIKINV